DHRARIGAVDRHRLAGGEHDIGEEALVALDERGGDERGRKAHDLARLRLRPTRRVVRIRTYVELELQRCSTATLPWRGRVASHRALRERRRAGWGEPRDRFPCGSPHPGARRRAPTLPLQGRVGACGTLLDPT